MKDTATPPHAKKRAFIDVSDALRAQTGALHCMESDHE